MNTPKVSIIMPSLNVGPFIRQCIESAINQTLKDIQIICVDAGSTDGTLEILQEYAAQDSRIQIILSDVKSYGYQMNLGLSAAKGEYIGILETDDWAEPDMFEVLWETAKAHGADMVKSNYYWHTAQNGTHDEPFENLKNCPYDTLFSVLNDRRLFSTTPAIWSGIYSRSMLSSNKILFNETPGASFQDTSFHFMVCTVSQRCYLLRNFFLHYRKDNAGSSVYSLSKVNCIVDEMHYYEHFLTLNSGYEQEISKFYQSLKFEKYRWNYLRLPLESKYVFLKQMHCEFSQADKDHLLDKAYFTPLLWDEVSEVVKNPIGYFNREKMRVTQELGRFPTFSYTVLKQADIQNPLVSVIIPIFNVEEYLSQCLDSIVKQTLKNIEIICINDGSFDSSLQIAEKYATSDHRISIVDQVNGGQSCARNAGIKLARGKYIYFMDSDDYILPETLEKLYAVSEKLNTDILYFGAESFFESKEMAYAHANYIGFYYRCPVFKEVMPGDVVLQDQLKNWKFRCSVPLQFINRSFLNETGLTFKEGIIHEDELFSCVLAAKAHRVLCIQDNLYIRRIRANSTMTAMYTAEKFTGQFIVAMTLLSTTITDQTLSQVALEDLIFHAQKILRDAKSTYSKLSSAEKSRIPVLLPPEYRPYYIEMKFSLDGSNAEMRALKKSKSYRIGRTITFLPRKLKGFIQCILDHGLAYTVRYGCSKLLHKFCSLFQKCNRLICGGIQCVKDHGVRYTLKRALIRLHIIKENPTNL